MTSRSADQSKSNRYEVKIDLTQAFLRSRSNHSTDLRVGDVFQAELGQIIHVFVLHVLT